MFTGKRSIHETYKIHHRRLQTAYGDYDQSSVQLFSLIKTLLSFSDFCRVLPRKFLNLIPYNICLFIKPNT